MKNMHQMAEDTADLRKKLLSGEKQIEMVRSRMNDMEKENAALRMTNSSKEGEIRQLNDQITEHLLKLRLFDQSNIGLLDKLRAQNESEEIILHAQKEHIVNLSILSEKYNNVLNENEKLRAEIMQTKKEMERQLMEREERLKENESVFQKEKSELVRKEELVTWQEKYRELERKHKELLRLQIGSAASNKQYSVKQNMEFNPEKTLDMLAADMHRLKGFSEQK